ncbi:MAG: GlsB/YeaQ/YmgE family stress response membrane protein [Betaproteobacteria bacterium]|nr:GlsB/YeaQ/YmgE family stress response membrane protein [Betaproteobacteria bacterium]
MGIVGIIGTIIVGFVVGLLARFFYPGAVNLGFWMTTLLGIGGSVVGGLIAGLLFKSGSQARSAPGPSICSRSSR